MIIDGEEYLSPNDWSKILSIRRDRASLMISNKIPHEKMLHKKGTTWIKKSDLEKLKTEIKVEILEEEIKEIQKIKNYKEKKKLKDFSEILTSSLCLLFSKEIYNTIDITVFLLLACNIETKDEFARNYIIKTLGISKEKYLDSIKLLEKHNIIVLDAKTGTWTLTSQIYDY